MLYNFLLLFLRSSCIQSCDFFPSVFSLQVNEELMTGVSHTKAVTTIRKAKGLVHLIVSRPPDQNPNTYLAYLPINSDKCNGNTGTSRHTQHVYFRKVLSDSSPVLTI